jgi:glycosyltransferase involved in cell wall biosynthesis
MDDSPLVSVFIPVHNAESFVAQAIESVLAQTYPHYELIVINDASTDGTAEVIARYEDHPKVRIHHNPANVGMAPNWNVGLRLAQGDLVAKLDADDFYESNFLEEIVAVFQRHPAVGLVFSGVNLIHDNGRVTRERRYLTSWVRSGRKFLQQLLRACVIRSPTVCVRRVCYEHLGEFLPQMKLHADWEMWVRIAARYDVGYVAKYLASYRLPCGDSCTSQAYTDERSIDDLRLWLSLLEQDVLPYRLNEFELSFLREGMYDLMMTFAVYALDRNLTESVQRYLSLAENLLPGGTKGSPHGRLCTWAAAVYLAERRGWARVCYFLLKSLSYGLPYQEWWRIFKIWITRWFIMEAIRLFEAGANLFPG